MKKKLLTVVLSAVMVLGSTISAFAVESSELNGSSSTTGGVQLDASYSISDETVATVQKDATVEGLADAKLEVSVPTKAELQAVATAGATLLKDKVFEVVELDLFKADAQLTKLDSAVKVTLPVFENIANAKYISVYRLDDTKLTLLDTVEVKDGKFTFETDHFSTYVFVEAAAPAAEPETGDTAPIATAVAVAAFAAVAVGVVALKKKNA